MSATVAHPQTCHGCRKQELRRILDRSGNVEQESGQCLNGREWGHGCPDYAEATLPGWKSLGRL